MTYADIATILLAARELRDYARAEATLQAAYEVGYEAGVIRPVAYVVLPSGYTEEQRTWWHRGYAAGLAEDSKGTLPSG